MSAPPLLVVENNRAYAGLGNNGVEIWYEPIVVLGPGRKNIAFQCYRNAHDTFSDVDLPSPLDPNFSFTPACVTSPRDVFDEDKYEVGHLVYLFNVWFADTRTRIRGVREDTLANIVGLGGPLAPDQASTPPSKKQHRDVDPPRDAESLAQFLASGPVLDPDTERWIGGLQRASSNANGVVTTPKAIDTPQAEEPARTRDTPLATAFSNKGDFSESRISDAPGFQQQRGSAISQGYAPLLPFSTPFGNQQPGNFHHHTVPTSNEATGNLPSTGPLHPPGPLPPSSNPSNNNLPTLEPIIYSTLLQAKNHIYEGQLQLNASRIQDIQYQSRATRRPASETAAWIDFKTEMMVECRSAYGDHGSSSDHLRNLVQTLELMLDAAIVRDGDGYQWWMDKLFKWPKFEREK